MARTGERLVVDNRRARHDYHLLERVEAGLVLTGTEVKSLREGRASLQQAYADVRDGEAWLVGAHISTYDQGNIANHDPDRDRKLLLHKKELASLAGKVAQQGLTLVPTKLYFKDGRAKVELALARGKEDGNNIKTITGQTTNGTMHAVQEAFHEQHGLQCGYCTPGFVMAAVSLLTEIPNPSEEEIRHALEGNLCRCTGYHNIVRAVQTAAGVEV